MTSLQYLTQHCCLNIHVYVSVDNPNTLVVTLKHNGNVNRCARYLDGGTPIVLYRCCPSVTRGLVVLSVDD